AAATAVRHQVVPRPGGLAVPVPDGLTARVVVEPLGAPRASVRLRPGGAAEPWAAGPVPRLHLYAGADRAAVLEALADSREAAGREAAAGPARLAILAQGHEALAAPAGAARRPPGGGGAPPHREGFPGTRRGVARCPSCSPAGRPPTRAWVPNWSWPFQRSPPRSMPVTLHCGCASARRPLRCLPAGWACSTGSRAPCC